MKYFILAILLGLNIAATCQTTEVVVFSWPKGEKWNLVSTVDSVKCIIKEFLKEGENKENWTEKITEKTLKAFKGISKDKDYSMKMSMLVGFAATKDIYPEAILTELKKDTKANCPWIIFKIEVPGKYTEILHMIQGENEFFVTIWKTRKNGISKKEQSKWIRFLKGGKIKIN